MKTALLCFFIFCGSLLARDIELEVIPHKVIYDERTFVRTKEDVRLSLWTDDTSKALSLLESLGIKQEGFRLKQGEVLVVFFNDSIMEDLTRIIFNKTANKTFADYAESGIQFKLMPPPEGKKYSHLTAVVFTSGPQPNFWIRQMHPPGYLSVKYGEI